MLVLGVEDRFGPEAEPNPSRYKDNDFNDLVFGVRFGSPTEKVLVVKDAGAGLAARITDEDSTEMASAVITLTGFAGDVLVLDPAVAAGTGIEITRVSDTEIRLQGLSSIENYETVISAASVEIELDEPVLGPREIAVTVTDPEGNSGDATSTFVVDDNLLAGTDGPDEITGTSVTTPDSDGHDVISGRGGDDKIVPRSGDDFVDGGDGRDTIDASGPGTNIIIGGPQPDLITLGPGTDTVRITGLADGADTIRNFNATEGDRLDLSLLFRDSDITADTFGQFVRTDAIENGVKVQVDLDGGGTDHRFVDIAFLVNPVGVTTSTDPASFIITPDNDPAVV